VIDNYHQRTGRDLYKIKKSKTQKCAIFMVTACISSNKYFIIQLVHSVVGLLKTH